MKLVRVLSLLLATTVNAAGEEPKAKPTPQNTRLQIAACQKKPKNLDDENCALAKRRVSRTDREKAGLCSRERYERALPGVRSQLAQRVAKDVLERPWPWGEPLNLEACGYADAPDALDLEFALKTPDTSTEPGGVWFNVSAFTLDGKTWTFDELTVSGPRIRFPAHLSPETREAIEAAAVKAVPWMKTTTGDRSFEIQTRDVWSYRDFDKHAPNAKYAVRFAHTDFPATCATATLFLSDEPLLRVLHSETKPPAKCPGVE